MYLSVHECVGVHLGWVVSAGRACPEDEELSPSLPSPQHLPGLYSHVTHPCATIVRSKIAKVGSSSLH